MSGTAPAVKGGSRGSHAWASGGAVSAVAAFAVALAGMVGWSLSGPPRPFYYDSGVYWALRLTFTSAGHFSFLTFDSPLRGYLWPLVDRYLQLAGGAAGVSDSSTCKVCNCVLLALIATVLVPRLAEQTWPDRPWGLVRRLCLAGVALVMWGGYLPYPLTDLPGATAVMVALVSCTDRHSPARTLVTGIACAVALNMRPAYLLLTPAVVLVWLCAWWRERGTAPPRRLRTGLCLALAVAGFTVVSLPQALATHHNFRRWSIIPGSVAGLTAIQYTDGLQLQLYDTYVGSAPGIPPQMYFFDPTGRHLLHGHSINTVGQYAVVVLEHPIDVLGTWVHHVVNGLDQRYDTPYVSRLRIDDWWMRIGGFALVFLALLRVAAPLLRSTLGPARWRYPAALLLANLTVIASAVEPRFMITPAFLCWATVLAPGWSRLRHTRERGADTAPLSQAALALVGLAAFVVVVVVITHDASAHLHL